jgi:ATP-dependent protease ClpP protease subunit
MLPQIVIRQERESLPPELYAVFCDQLNENSVHRFFDLADLASRDRVKSAHILFQSSGGSVGDGVCLYNFFRALRFDVTLYNVGSIQSIAVIAYLGAEHRKTSAHALFQLHRTVLGLQGPNALQAVSAAELSALSESADMDDKRTAAILRAHVRLSKKDWEHLRRVNILDITAQDSVTIGLAHEIGDFSPPPGTRIFSI